MLAVERSAVLAAVLALFHLLALIATGLAHIPLWVQLPIAALIALSYYCNHQLAAVPTTLVWHKGDHWHISRAKLVINHATLERVDFFSRWLVIITLKSGRRLDKFVISRDSLDSDTFRLLRVRLRIEGIAQLSNRQSPPF